MARDWQRPLITSLLTLECYHAHACLSTHVVILQRRDDGTTPQEHAFTCVLQSEVNFASCMHSAAAVAAAAFSLLCYVVFVRFLALVLPKHTFAHA